ncbi:hypothetical protein [Listeria seeligeri]|uniref:hypothetical protein n=1 Tax=Listeria seeligeri TaxID=1640 RepID=UPI0022EB8483|nr:hypothetical protein [Listeria seeligeri]
MRKHTLEQDFDQFCLARIDNIFEDENNHQKFQESYKHYYKLYDQLEILGQPEITAYLEAIEKYQVEAFLYIYKIAFKEGMTFVQNKEKETI